MPDSHAKLGPSSAHRWMACPRSVAFEATLPDNSTDYAAEGTLAHSMCEMKLRHKYLGLSEEDMNGGLDFIRGDPLYTQEMEACTDRYVDFVSDIMDQYRLAGMDPHIYVEVKLDLTQWIPEGFGTSDAVIIANDTLTVIDFKYGKGVPVSAEENPQMRCYALGAYHEFEMLEEFSKVTTFIFQPRIDNVSSETISVSALLIWGGNELRPAAERAWEDHGDFEPGEHCRFCRGRFLCRFNAAYQLSLYDLYTNDKRPAPMSELEIAGILEYVDQINSWATGLKEYALKNALNGTTYPGWKLVAGKGSRKITDESKALELLHEAGYEDSAVMELKNLTGLEKAVGKKKLAEVLKDVLEKTEGKPTLAHESDKRKALDLSAKESDYFKEG